MQNLIPLPITTLQKISSKIYQKIHQMQVSAINLQKLTTLPIMPIMSSKQMKTPNTSLETKELYKTQFFQTKNMQAPATNLQKMAPLPTLSSNQRNRVRPIPS